MNTITKTNNCKNEILIKTKKNERHPIQSTIYLLSVCLINSIFENKNIIELEEDLLILALVKIPLLCKSSYNYCISNCPASLILIMLEIGIISNIYNHFSHKLFHKLIRNIRNDKNTIITNYSSLIMLMQSYSILNNVPKMLFIKNYLNLENNQIIASTIEEINSSKNQNNTTFMILKAKYIFSSEDKISKNIIKRKLQKDMLYCHDCIPDLIENVGNSDIILMEKKEIIQFEVAYCLLKNRYIDITPKYFFENGLCISAMKDTNIEVLKYYYSYIPDLINKELITRNIVKNIKNCVLLSLSKIISKNINISRKLFNIVYKKNSLFQHLKYFLDNLVANNSDNVYNITNFVHYELLFKITHLAHIFKDNFIFLLRSDPSINMIKYYVGQSITQRCNIEKVKHMKKWCKKVLGNPKSSNKKVKNAIKKLIKCHELEINCDCISIFQYSKVFNLYRCHPNRILLQYLEYYSSHFEFYEILELIFNAYSYSTGTIDMLSKRIFSIETREKFANMIINGCCLNEKDKNCFLCNIGEGEHSRILGIINICNFKETPLLIKAYKIILTHKYNY